MNVTLNWSEGMVFRADASGHDVLMDAKAPIGKNSAATPKEFVAMGLAGCTAMDVVALLKKYKQTPKSMRVEVEIESSSGGHPVVFNKADLTFVVEGEVDEARLLEAVRLSQTKFCGVSAMLSKAIPIYYNIKLNGREIGSGQASFT